MYKESARDLKVRVYDHIQSAIDFDSDRESRLREVLLFHVYSAYDNGDFVEFHMLSNTFYICMALHLN